jgi:hypothetical protein
MAMRNVSQKPLWNTEAGWSISSLPQIAKQQEGNPQIVEGGGANTPISVANAANYIARAYILNWAAGIDMFSFYDWDSSSMGLVEKSGTLREEATTAYTEIYNWLVGAMMVSCNRDKDGTWTAVLTRENGYRGMIVWNPERDVIVDNNQQDWHFTSAKNLRHEVQSLKGVSQVKVTGSPILLE